MRNKNASVKSNNSVYPSSLFGSNISGGTFNSSALSQQLFTYYKNKCEKLEKDHESFLHLLDQVKSACDLNYEVQQELNEKNEEISKLQKIIGDLQIHLFRERDENLKLRAENDEFRIQDHENKKRIKALLMVTGMCERKLLHFITTCPQEKFMQPQLPQKLQKLKEDRQRELTGMNGPKGNGDFQLQDPQTLLLKNQLLASQLEHHIKISREQVEVLINEKQISDEEKSIEKQRLQKEVDFLSGKLKQAQDLLCETTGKLMKLQQMHEREKTTWVEQKERYIQTIAVLKDKEDIDVSDIAGFCINGIGSFRHKKTGREPTKGSSLSEKDQLAATYKEQVLALESEVRRLREKAEFCRNTFKEKTAAMAAQVSHLKNKYEDLDRRRQLEGEGFRTDIRMLRERVKELEKKLAKASGEVKTKEQQQLLASARNTLNRARLLEKELEHMKTKMSTLEPSQLNS